MTKRERHSEDAGLPEALERAAQASRAARLAEAAAEEAIAARNHAIRRAIEQGFSVRRIGEVVGLTGAAVHRIGQVTGPARRRRGGPGASSS
ncbi:MAG: hypothetical protein AB1416_00340 [Actinomycetota bacterium]